MPVAKPYWYAFSGRGENSLETNSGSNSSGKSMICSSQTDRDQPSGLDGSIKSARSGPNARAAAKPVMYKGARKQSSRTSAGSWLIEPPYESVYFASIVAKDVGCELRQKWRSLDDVSRTRFFAMRKYVQDLQVTKLRSLERKYPTHSRTLDLAFIFIEDYVMEHVVNNNRSLGKRVNIFTQRGKVAHMTMPSQYTVPGGGVRDASLVFPKRSFSLGPKSNGAASSMLSRYELKMLANVGLWVACKVEEVIPPLVEGFSETTLEEFTRFERKLSSMIKWRYNPITSSDFLNFFMASEGYRAPSLERHIMNQVLRTEIRFQFETMVTVVASILLGGAYSGRERKIFDANVMSVSRVDRDVLVSCMDAIHDLLHAKVSQSDADIKRAPRYPKLCEWILRWEPSSAMISSRSVKPSAAHLRGMRDQRFGVWLSRSQALQAHTKAASGVLVE